MSNDNYSRIFRSLWITCALIASFGSTVAPAVAQDDGEDILTIDRYLLQRSTVPAIEGQFTQLFVRERVRPELASGSRDLAGRVVLFVHGGSSPGHVAFDVPYQDYSWMAYLAEAGFDAFSVDFTGYGRSTRPNFMNDPCNAAKEDQVEIGIEPCDPSYPYAMTTIASDWDDIDRIVDYVLELRQVEKVSLIGWSRGGHRIGGYAAQNPEKVDKLVFMAHGYDGSLPSVAPSERAEGVAMRALSEHYRTTTWDRQVGCQDQYDPAVAQVIWSELLRSDPVAATWGPGMFRAPNTDRWGFSEEITGQIQTPALLIVGEFDDVARPERVRNLYEDLGAESKVFIDLACSSHNAPWESNHLLLFEASLEWLRDGTVDGISRGVIRKGY